MDYTIYSNQNYDILRTTDNPGLLTGNQTLEQNYPDSVVTDSFHIIQKIKSQDYGDIHYDWYAIDRHYRMIDKTPRLEKANEEMKKVQDDNDAMLVDQEYRLTMMELGV